MPTGYTACVEDGTVTEFPQFAMRCARAFGALVHMRDDSLTAEVPDEIPLHSHYADSLAEAREALVRLGMQSAHLKREYELDFNRRVQSALECNAEYALQRQRYQAMVEKVAAWIPPTKGHVRLKEFMLEQLDISMPCSDMPIPEREDPEEWLRRERKSASEQIKYAQKSLAEAEQRNREANAWVKALRESLQGAEVAQ